MKKFLLIIILMITPGLIAQINLSTMWQSGDYWKVRTYDGHASSGIYYAADFYFNSRNRPDIYKNGDPGLSGRPIIAPIGGTLFIHLLDVTDYGTGQFPLVNASRVFQGLDPIPQNCFSIVDSLNSTRRIDMSLIIDFNSNAYRINFSHLQINNSYFSSTVQQKIRNAVRKFFNGSAVGSPRRVAVSIGSSVSTGIQVGTMNNWGIASEPHLHFQLFNGSGYSESSPYLGNAQNLSNASVVTIVGQKIFDTAFEGTYGSGNYHYPAMLRRFFALNSEVNVNAAWDGGNGARLRSTPGGNEITIIGNGNIGIIKQSTPIYAKLSSNNYLWYNVQFGSNTGWMAAEYIDPAPTGLENDFNQLSFELQQNYPNPFNPQTLISYSLPQTEFVSLKVYDIVSNEIANLVNEEKSSGNHSVVFDGNNLASGIYFYTIQAGTFNKTKKMILAK